MVPSSVSSPLFPKHVFSTGEKEADLVPFLSSPFTKGQKKPHSHCQARHHDWGPPELREETSIKLGLLFSQPVSHVPICWQTERQRQEKRGKKEGKCGLDRDTQTEREREREKGRKKAKEIETKKKKVRKKQKEKNKEKGRGKKKKRKNREKEKERKKEKETERNEKERGRKKEKETKKKKVRKKEKEKNRKRQREKEKERGKKRERKRARERESLAKSADWACLGCGPTETEAAVIWNTETAACFCVLRQSFLLPPDWEAGGGGRTDGDGHNLLSSTSSILSKLPCPLLIHPSWDGREGPGLSRRGPGLSWPRSMADVECWELKPAHLKERGLGDSGS
ncbi:RNA-binding protein 25, partial [Ophiophagus hannah]